MTEIDQLGFWKPKKDKSFTNLLDLCSKDKNNGGKGFSNEEIETLKTQTENILRKCVHPSFEDCIRTGLIIGKIQSGKTLSFSALSCLAKDNSIRVIIIISGTKTNLFDQTKDRVKEDIIGGQERFWRPLTAKELNHKEAKTINNELDEDDEMSLIISCMKNKSQLKKVTDFFKSSNFDFNALIIDDESDQAGLNTKANSKKKNEESPTYKNIVEFRKCFKSHTYLLYTATPQANLLIERDDNLSPNFGLVISPGESYTGIKEFFKSKNSKKMVKIIPASQNHKNSEDMPETLREAILCFLIGLGDGHVKGENRNRDSIRTMYIHPDREIIHHDLYKRWVERFLQDQIDGISINDVQNTIKNLKKSYDDIQSTFKNISKFDKIIERLPHAIYKLLAGGVLSYNGETLGEYDHFPWSNRYGWIVIGGDKLERGFTVEGCTVTYMPRVAKINNQDTVIQRGRFLGYRKKYIDLCRLYLDYDIKEIFENYHTSEEQLEAFFKQFNKKQEKEGIDLNLRNETRLLSMYAVNTRITRRNILAQKPKFIDIGGWSYANFPDQISSEDLSKNRKIYNEIYNNLDRENFGLKEYINLAEIDKSVKLREWTEKRIKPKYTLNFSAKKLIKYLINFHFSDSEHDKTLRKQLIFYLDKASKLSEKLAIIQMKADERSIYNSDGIPIFSPLGGPDKADSDKIVRDYPGDRKIKSPNIPTLLLYKLNIKEKSNDKNLIKENVPVLAINFPQRHNTIGVYN